ncbi:hypothetical protein KIPB_000762 [Kipferlia bialata]|uniref:Uncharacterized protein n=1 Tax=Kipferlia bialata TaxID=797122 RepID=A0A391NIA3_9EUKA|nr:hypothetical protein KIPB_000762 [Kipferlia bialata]|eukprot:g762.t1
MPITLPIRYSANIQCGGQCRQNLSMWRGVWTLSISAEPVQEGLEDGGSPCMAVLTYQPGPKDTTQTRWYGTASRDYVCGDYDFLTVDWTACATGVRTSAALSCLPADLGAENLSENALPPALQHAFLIRNRYLMWGETGNALDPGTDHDGNGTADNCIRLDVVAGYRGVTVD